MPEVRVPSFFSSNARGPSYPQRPIVHKHRRLSSCHDHGSGDPDTCLRIAGRPRHRSTGAGAWMIITPNYVIALAGMVGTPALVAYLLALRSRGDDAPRRNRQQSQGNRPHHESNHCFHELALLVNCEIPHVSRRRSSTHKKLNSSGNGRSHSACNKHRCRTFLFNAGFPGIADQAATLRR